MVLLTPNEATIFAAIAGAVIAPLLSILTSILTTRYTLRHGPNYETQIKELHQTLQQQIGATNASLTKLSETQRDLLRQQAEFEQAAEVRRVKEMQQLEAARWRPEASLCSDYVGSELKNELILKSGREFAIRDVALLTSEGAKLPRISIDPGVQSTGFRVRIPHSDIIAMVNGNIDYGRSGQCSGAVWYRVSSKDVDYEGRVPFVARQETKSNTIWIRLVG